MGNFVGKTRYYYDNGNGELTDADAVSLENAYLMGFIIGEGLVKLIRLVNSDLIIDTKYTFEINLIFRTALY